MAYDEGLAQRIRELVDDMANTVEKKMFGGVCYLVDGNMACGVYKTFLIVRVGPDRYEDSLTKPFTRVFDITGKVMKGWVMVEEGGYADDEDLSEWVEQGVSFAKSLPLRRGALPPAHSNHAGRSWTGVQFGIPGCCNHDPG